MAPQSNIRSSRAPASTIPDHGVHEAGRFRTTQKEGEWIPHGIAEAHNFGPDRVSFGYDPSKPHALHMKAKETSGRRNMFGVMATNESSVISVQQWRCVMVRNRNANCMRCAQACTSDCITIENDRLSVDASRCVGCGTCATVCPTCAIETRNPSDAELLGSARVALGENKSGGVGATAVIACRLLVDALEGIIERTKITEVVCLGRVDETLLLGLVESGADEIILACGNCSNCEQSPGLDCARMVVDTASELLAVWGNKSTVRIQQGAPEIVLCPGVSLKDAQERIDSFFLQKRANTPLRTAEFENDAESSVLSDDLAGGEERANASQDTYDSSIGSVLKVMSDGTLPHFIPARRERLLDTLFGMGVPADNLVSTRLWGHVCIDADKCVSCRMCAVFCPTGAIANFGEQDSEDFGVEHYPGDCVNCGTCEAICPQDAITINKDVHSSYLLGGKVHRYPMLPRAVAFNNTHQIVNTMRSYIDGDIFER